MTNKFNPEILTELSTIIRAKNGAFRNMVKWAKRFGRDFFIVGVYRERYLTWFKMELELKKLNEIL